MPDKTIRQLAAVMFTDLEGYTALMQENEQKAREVRDRHRRILEPSVASHNGKILQYYGDGTLCMFGSASDAVDCAVVIQRELQQEPKIPLRIGIHMGDIVYDEEGVYGDSVNIASRIESLSVPGAVLVSNNVYDEIKNKPHLPAKHIGIFELKNVKRPVDVFAVTADGLVVPKPEDVKGKAKDAVKTIAVLPFVNMSADPENEYFSDGITEELINSLTRVDGLQVTSRTSSFAFKGKQEDVREIGTKLNVTTVLEGSVRKAGDRVRISAQLINTRDGYHVWSEVYNRKLEDIFELQDEISREIANKVCSARSPNAYVRPGSGRYVDVPTHNVEAYNLYLKGLYNWNKWSPENIRRAIKFYEEAIALEPNFAKAYSGLANCYVVMGSIGMFRPESAYPKAKEYAAKSLELDDKIADSHVSVALTKLFFEWDWDGANREFQKALELSPGWAGVHQTYSYYLTAVGRAEEAVEELEKAAELDPLSLQVLEALGNALVNVDRLDDALKQFQKAVDLDPNYRSALEGLGLCYALKGETEKAFKTIKEMQRLAGGEDKCLAQLGFVYASAGMTDKASECLNKLKIREQNEKDTNFDLDFAILYSGLKDFDNTFKRLEHAIECRLGGIVFMKSYYTLKPFQNDPRFKNLLKKIGLE